jgi:hypothetical protein
LQLNGQSDEIFLICNTHLYFHPHADVVRCFQAMIEFERIKEIKTFYEQQVIHYFVFVFYIKSLNRIKMFRLYGVEILMQM